MAKISALPELLAPVGTEPVVVLSGGRAKRAPLSALVNAAAQPAIARAELAADSAVDAALRLSPFAVDVSGTRLADIIDVSADGVAYAAANFYVLYFLQNVGASANRLTIARVSDNAIVADFVGGVPLEGINTLLIPAVGGSGISFVVRADFRDGGSFYWTTGTAANARLDPDKIVFATPPVKAAIAGAVADLADEIRHDPLLSSALGSGAWSARMRDPFLRRLFPEVFVYHANRANDHHLKQLSFYGGAGGVNPYLRVVLGDLTTGASLVQARFDLPAPASSALAAKAEFAAWLAENHRAFIATDELYGFNNRLAWLVADWSALTDLGYGDHYYNSVELGGINASRVYDDGTAGRSYLDSDHYHELIYVPAGGTWLDDIIASLQGPEPGISNRAHFHHRIRLLLAEGIHYSTNKELPAFVELQGMGVKRTIVRHRGATPREVIAGYRDNKVFDVRIESALPPQYSWHTDAANGRSFDSLTGEPNRFFYQSFKRVDFVLTGDNIGQGFGCGVSQGQVIEFEACRAWHKTTALGGLYVSAGFYFHNTGKTIGFPTQINSVRPARVKMTSCSSADDWTESVYLQSLEATAGVTLEITDSPFAMLRHEVVQNEVVTDLARDRIQFAVAGVLDCPFWFKDIDGAWVLAAPPGVAIGGALAALMFGTLDEFNRGEKSINGGTTVSLGARLGNRTGNAQALTLNGQSWTPTTNLTAASNATIIAAILAATGVQLTEVDLRLEFRPDAAPFRRMNNNSGVLIPKGRRVKRTALGKIALAQPGDRTFGWTIRAIRNGDDGDVMIGRRIWWEYLDGVTAAQINGGDFWPAADGLISFDAPARNILPGDNSATATAIRLAVTEADKAAKIGRLIGGTAEIW